MPPNITVYAKENDQPQPPKKDMLVKTPGLNNLLVGVFSGGASGIDLPAKLQGAELLLYFDGSDLLDVWLVVT